VGARRHARFDRCTAAEEDIEATEPDIDDAHAPRGVIRVRPRSTEPSVLVHACRLRDSTTRTNATIAYYTHELL
jgi:hypothetical protein